MEQTLSLRLGYVAMSVLLSNASPSQTMTVKQFEQIIDKEAGIRKLERIATSNLENCLRILKHNKAHEIEFFRLSSRLVPLANHPLTEGWKYERALSPLLKEIGDFVKKENMRIDFHPDHFVVLNGQSKEILQQSLRTLVMHYKLLKEMGISPIHRCVLHVGGKKQGREEGLEQFIENFSMIPVPIQKMIMIENDDVNYPIEDVLYIGEKLNIPVVFDLHHFDVLHEEDQLNSLWQRVVATWKDSPLPVKMHISSPKEGETDRRHHDYINADRFTRFITTITGTVDQLDVMIEAKQKDAALLRLLEDLKTMKEITVKSPSSITVKGTVLP
ncbi:UV DNA damage repair endonuclease UvsE [Halalkalibacter akibai]|uniref:UV-endonuclease UvdE family n=1 Tax=Halalkalibacter akibai (strain ATCC 43226 / DSM 21942 / CIP 109018 / JCM 9157 / 1139) TaxID=1236973 RepID=W4QR59_HALA3|nr:UV DNA damage repair endonuclease UvsE [Halalkalibacter akibai]GAE33829.1 UV-endonuclease UvdE family [Halalkalibacter akibai JCM 9157]